MTQIWKNKITANLDSFNNFLNKISTFKKLTNVILLIKFINFTWKIDLRLQKVVIVRILNENRPSVVSTVENNEDLEETDDLNVHWILKNDELNKNNKFDLILKENYSEHEGTSCSDFEAFKVNNFVLYWN